MTSKNAINNTIPDNDFSVNRATAGTAVVSTVSHSDNTNTASNAISQITVGGTSGGDPVQKFTVTGGSTWTQGVDNSDSDSFALSTSADIATPQVINITTAGEVTLPLQSSFIATHTVAQDNATGNGTIATVNFTTEVVDRNNDYDGTNTFTAPVSGLYSFYAQAQLVSATGASFCILNMITSNKIYVGPFSIGTINGVIVPCVSALADMDALDTCYITIQSTGVGADTADLNSDGNSTYFFGNLEA